MLAVEIARRKRKTGPLVPVGGSARKSFRSLPAQKASPAPLNWTTLTALSASAWAMASVIASYIAGVTALRLSGR